jgi:L-aminopeptidase/D-esterase-like protein
MSDGDTVFALALGTASQPKPETATTASQVSMIGAAAAVTLARAIINAVRNATALHGVPAAQT